MIKCDDFVNNDELHVVDCLEQDGTLQLFKVTGKMPDLALDVSEWGEICWLAGAKVSIHRKTRKVKIEEISVVEEDMDVNRFILQETIERFAKEHGYSMIPLGKCNLHMVIGENQTITCRMVFK